MNEMIATFFGVGRLRPAPGTWGSLAAVVIAVIVFELGAAPLIPILFVMATIAGFMVLPRMLKSPEDDPSEVVIDEVAGQLLALCFTVIPLYRHGVEDLLFGAWPAWVAPFLFFRLFDIWKPWLVGRADRKGGTSGVMMDDLWAGLFAGLLSMACAGLYHAVIEPMLG